MQTNIRNTAQTRNGIVVETTNNRYCFPYLKGDEVRGGTRNEIEGTVTYGGDSVSKHYITSHDMSGVPQAVLDTVAEYATILDGVDGGWASWDGRPEFSTSYVDISEATAVE